MIKFEYLGFKENVMSEAELLEQEHLRRKIENRGFEIDGAQSSMADQNAKMEAKDAQVSSQLKKRHKISVFGQKFS